MARQHRSLESREHVIEAARRTIAQLGLRGATMRAIADEAGVSTGYITHYFENKQHLVMAALDRNNAHAEERVLRACGSARGADAIAATVEALLPLDDERRLEWGVWVAFWTVSATDPESAAAMQAARQALVTILAGPFADAVDADELPPGLDFEYEAERLLVLASGVGLMVNARDPDEARDLGRRMLADHLARLRSGAAETL